MRRIIIVILLVCTTLSFASIPKFNTMPLRKRQRVFINYLKPRAQTLNRSILRTRQQVEGLYERWQSTKTLSVPNRQWLIALADNYNINDAQFVHPGDWVRLLKRVDIVPVSMILAQAANESSWGSSRFAQQGLNLFGQWCYQPGCGIVPLKRPPGRRYEVQKFSTINASIQAYVHNLNTNNHYAQFRNLRFHTRNSKKNLSGYTLAQGLKNYSERKNKYVKSIQSMITNYQLERYNIS